MNFKQIILFLLSSTIIFSCFQATEIDDSDNTYPITLRLLENKNSTVLEWDKFTSSSFRKYILIRSTKPITDGLNPKLVNSSLILTEITNINTTMYYDHLISVTPIFYYKLYVDVGNRFIESQNLEVKTSLHIFSSMISSHSVQYYADLKTAILPQSLVTDRTLRLFNIDDYDIKPPSENIPIHISATTAYPSLFYTDKNLESTYYFTYNTSLAKLELPSLKMEIVADIPNVFLAPPYSLVCNDKFLLYLHRDVDESMLVFSRQNNTLLKGHSSLMWNEKRLLHLLDNQGDTFAEISEKEVTIFSLKENGEYIPQRNVTLPHSGELLNKVVASKDGQYLIFNKNGSIYTTDFELIYANTCTDCTNFFFSNDSKALYSLHTSSGSTTVRKYSLPDYLLLETFSIINTFTTIIPTDVGIGIFGTMSGTNGISFFKELNF